MTEREHVHEYFGLTYSNFLVMHRAVMQSMPEWWQKLMVDLLIAADAAVPDELTASSYSLIARGERGRIIKDPMPHYARGRTVIPLGEVEKPEWVDAAFEDKKR